MHFDLIIRNGELIDGTGTPACKTDIGISGERITAIGNLSAATAPRTIDATNLKVTPGFIDTHAHSDAYLLLEPDAPSKLTQGITTEINGQCGGSAAPLLGSARMPSDWASQTYPRESPNGVVPSTMPGAHWTTLSSYRRLFEAVRPAINSIQFIGHNTLRAGVIGYAPEPATSDQVKALVRNLEQALDEGGWGLSTGLLYQPGKYATAQELDALAESTAARGGIYASHIRSEGNQLLESVAEVTALARRHNLRAHISHLKTSGKDNWHKIDALLELFETSRAQGLALHADRYPYTAAGTDLDIVLPEWAAAGGRDIIMANLRDPAQRQRIEAELNNSGRDWNQVVIGGGWSPTVRPFSGKSIAAAATKLDISPGEVVCRFVEADETRTGAFFFGMSLANLHRIYQQPWVMVGSDASLRAPWGALGRDFPHPRAYGSMVRFIRLMTGREPDFPAIATLEETIRRITSLPATAYGISGRGTIRQGAFADIVVFNDSELKDHASYAKPHQFSSGIEHVIVNGALSYTHGSFTSHRRGSFLEP